MNLDETASRIGMMKLGLRDGSESDFLAQAAARIRALPGVLRVRVGLDRQEMEITFADPAEGLLRQINNALKSVGTEIAAAKVH